MKAAKKRNKLSLLQVFAFMLAMAFMVSWGNPMTARADEGGSVLEVNLLSDEPEELGGGKNISSIGNRIAKSNNNMSFNRTSGTATRVITNPYGKKGGLAHQSTVASITPIAKGGEIRYEVKYNTPNGSKNYRYADAVEVSEGKITQIYQVGRVNKNGTPVSREVQAINDIKSSPDYNNVRITYLPYNKE